jgi:hypothetical protein
MPSGSVDPPVINHLLRDFTYLQPIGVNAVSSQRSLGG